MTDDYETGYFDEEPDEDEIALTEFSEAYECRCGAIQYGENGAYRVADCVC